MEEAKKENIFDLCSGMVGTDGFDVHSFNDKLAELIDWSPIKPKGVLRTKRRIKKAGFNKFRYTIATQTKSLLIILISFGLISMIAGSFAFLLDTSSLHLIYLAVAVIGLATMTGAIAALFVIGNKFLFDKNKKLFKKKGNKIDLDKIHALQLIKKQFSYKKIAHTCYELNLVLEDASRLHLVDYDKLSHIKKDSKIISDFLKVKVWEKIS